MLMIRLARFGAKKKPTYRVVVIDKGHVIERGTFLGGEAEALGDMIVECLTDIVIGGSVCQRGEHRIAEHFAGQGDRPHGTRAESGTPTRRRFSNQSGESADPA